MFAFFLWNDFSNDARVYKEIQTLIKAGYRLSLVCLQGENNQSYSGIEIIRVEDKPAFIKKILQHAANKRSAQTLLGSFWSLLSRIGRLVFIRTKLSKATKGAYVIMQMIRKGKKIKAGIYQSNDLNTLLQGYWCAKHGGKKNKAHL